MFQEIKALMLEQGEFLQSGFDLTPSKGHL